MSDAAKPEQGWYWGTNPAGRGCPIECQTYPGHKPLFLVGNQVFIEALPNGWTLGPRIDDLLRDAARYRWLRDNCSYVYPMVAWGEPSPAECGIEWHWQQVKPDEAPDIDALIDAEIAREPKPEGE